MSCPARPKLCGWSAGVTVTCQMLLRTTCRLESATAGCSSSTVLLLKPMPTPARAALLGPLRVVPYVSSLLAALCQSSWKMLHHYSRTGPSRQWPIYQTLTGQEKKLVRSFGLDQTHAARHAEQVRSMVLVCCAAEQAPRFASRGRCWTASQQPWPLQDAPVPPRASAHSTHKSLDNYFEASGGAVLCKVNVHPQSARFDFCEPHRIARLRLFFLCSALGSATAHRRPRSDRQALTRRRTSSQRPHAPSSRCGASAKHSKSIDEASACGFSLSSAKTDPGIGHFPHQSMQRPEMPFIRYLSVNGQSWERGAKLRPPPVPVAAYCAQL